MSVAADRLEEANEPPSSWWIREPRLTLIAATIPLLWIPGVFGWGAFGPAEHAYGRAWGYGGESALIAFPLVTRLWASWRILAMTRAVRRAEFTVTPLDMLTTGRRLWSRLGFPILALTIVQALVCLVFVLLALRLESDRIAALLAFLWLAPLFAIILSAGDTFAVLAHSCQFPRRWGLASFLIHSIVGIGGWIVFAHWYSILCLAIPMQIEFGNSAREFRLVPGHLPALLASLAFFCAYPLLTWRKVCEACYMLR